MAIAERHLHNSQLLGRKDYVPNFDVHSSHAHSEAHAIGPTIAASSSLASIERHVENTIVQNDEPSNHPAIHATEQAEKYLNPDPTANFDTIDTLLSKGALEDLLRSIKAMNLPQLSGSTQPQASTIPPERLRKTLLPVILKNAQRRPDFNDKLVTKVEIGLREALTDQFCESLSQKITTIGREIQATRGSEEDVHATAIASSTDLSLKLATVAPEDDQNLSTALVTPGMTLPTVVFRIMKYLIVNFHLRRGLVLTVDAPVPTLDHGKRVLHHENVLVVPSRDLILQLPPAHRGRSRSPHSRKASFHDHESSFRRGSPDPGPRRTPIHMRSIDRTRLSPSHRRGLILDRPGLPIHRISRSPEPLSTVSNVSRRHPSPPLYKRSRSPISTNLQRHPLPSSPSRTHSLSPTRISFRHRLSRPPDENNPGLQGMRMSMRDAPHTIPKRDGRIPTPMLNHDRTKPPPTQDIIVVKREPDVEDSTVTLQPSPSSVLTPAVAPSSPVSSTQLDPIPSPPPPVSVVPMQSPLLPAHVPPTPLSPTESHIADQEPAHRSDMPSRLEEESRNEHSFSVETGADILSSSVPCPSPALAVSPKILPTHLSPQISSSVAPSPKPSQPSANSSLATQACLPVPGLWFAKNGHNQADIVDCEFAVNSETSRKWHLPGSSRHKHSAPEATSERLSLRLLCIPIELFQNINQIGSVPQSMDCGALTSTMASVKTVWPEQGSLLVQMNPTKPHKQAWFPEHMSPTSPGLDITDAVREGKNVLRLIQLEDMADKIFMLQASLLTPTSQQSPSTYWNVEDLNLADHLAIYNLSPATVEVI
ncbi:hypothetical protein J132_09124 [Termitomyces sp. J132]|nr:hypothetical protein J132_09124 [Termitomyces sp. J132]